MDDDLKTLSKKVLELEKRLNEEIRERKKQSRDYTQNRTFIERVTFRNRVGLPKLPTSATDLSTGDLYRVGTEVRVKT